MSLCTLKQPETAPLACISWRHHMLIHTVCALAVVFFPSHIEMSPESVLFVLPDQPFPAALLLNRQPQGASSCYRQHCPLHCTPGPGPGPARSHPPPPPASPPSPPQLHLASVLLPSISCQHTQFSQGRACSLACHSMCPLRCDTRCTIACFLSDSQSLSSVCVLESQPLLQKWTTA